MRDASPATLARSLSPTELLELVLHDLQTPLSTLLLWEGVLRATADDPSRRGEALDAIRRCVEQQVKLVTDLRDVTRASQGRLELERTRVEVTQVLGELHGHDGHDGHDAQHGHDASSPSGLARDRWVLADAELLRRAFARLFEHARELARVPSAIAVSFAEEPADHPGEHRREHVVRLEVREPLASGDGPVPPRLALVVARELLHVQGAVLLVHDPRSSFEVRLPALAASGA